MDSTLVPLGEPHGPLTSFCDPDEIVAFALAINDPNPAYLEGGATPPTYAVVPVFPAFIGLPSLPAGAIAGARGGVHGEHDLYIHRPIEPGMDLHTVAERCSVVTSKAGMNTFVRLVSTDDAGDPVITQYWSAMSMGEVTGGDQGSPPPDHSFPDEARERPVGTVSLATTRDQTYRYAGASGDRATIHVNDKAAIGIGFPRKFNQGLCTLGVTSRGLVELAAGGDPSRIRRVAVRFTSPTFPGDDIEVSVYDAGTTDAGLRSFAFEATSAGKVVLRHGRVEVTA
ncbi:MAG TPA: MaoC/PaaZ C-terminal domain-containing protein [Acidimicrobiales bacterium]|jgi:acyl dehydratase